MAFVRSEHASRSRFVEMLWSTVDVSDGCYVAAADACWDLIVVDAAGVAPTVLLSGPSTRPQELRYTAGRHNLGVRFRVGVRVLHDGQTMRDRTVSLRTERGRMQLAGAWRSIPTTVDALEALLTELTAEGALQRVRAAETRTSPGGGRAAQRARQRLLASTVGLSSRSIGPIVRARSAANRLVGGASIADVVWSLGYSDQSHLTRDLRRFTATTPRQAAQRGELV